MTERTLIECLKESDRDMLVMILARNGYSVRWRKVPKGESRIVYRWYVEFWKEGAV